jgi:hypothetical protein
MAHSEVVGVDGAALDRNAGTGAFFELGMMYATGRSVPTDFVTAHKWFNIAALKGNKEAIRLRREIAAECRMTISRRRSAPRAIGCAAARSRPTTGPLPRPPFECGERSVRIHRAFCHQTL